MLRNRKILFSGLLLLLSFLMIIGFGLYVYSYSWLEKSLVNAEEDLRRKGYTLAYSKMVFSGNPFELRVTVENPQIKDSLGRFEWIGQEMTVHLNTWNLYTLHCSFAGEQKLTVPQNTPIPLGTLSFGNAKADLKLTYSGHVDEILFTADSLFSLLGNKQQSVSLNVIKLKTSRITDPLNLAIELNTKIMGLEGLVGRSPLDHEAVIELNLNVSGYQKPSFPKTLADWRDGGGIIDVNLFKISWAPITAEVNGTLTLDKDMYPLGSFSTRIQGYQEALSFLVELGWVKSKNASAASFVLDILSQPNDLGIKHLTVPITLQNKKFSIGPASLFKLQPITGF